MSFKRGDPKPANGGRRAGTPNRITSDLRQMVSRALDRAGGVDYLRRQADENPVAFMSLLGRILPQRIESNAPLFPVPLSLEDERAEALREIAEAFASLRQPPPPIIEATAIEVRNEPDARGEIPHVEPPKAAAYQKATAYVGRRPIRAAPASRRSRY
jgi:hypothetical protein